MKRRSMHKSGSRAGEFLISAPGRRAYDGPRYAVLRLEETGRSCGTTANLLWSTLMNIFVGNLSRDVTEEDLLNAFAAYGRVQRASVLRDKSSGEPRGFGFVEMESKAEAQAAITA